MFLEDLSMKSRMRALLRFRDVIAALCLSEQSSFFSAPIEVEKRMDLTPFRETPSFYLRVVGIHHCLTGGSDCNRSLQFAAPRTSHPSYLRGIEKGRYSLDRSDTERKGTRTNFLLARTAA